MANTTRQNNLLVNQDWTRIYESFKNADFQSYDFQTLRKAMIDYLRLHYPEDFNDYTESSEYIALIDLIAFMGQNLAFRADLNTRENFLDTAERRDSILKLARLVSYNPKRNIPATGFLKFDSVQTTETLFDSNGTELSNLVIKWNDRTNLNWYEQFITIINSALPSSQRYGKPGNSQLIGSVRTDEYSINVPAGNLPVYKFQATVNGTPFNFEAVGATSIAENYVYEIPPGTGNPLNILHRNDNQGNASNNTGFFLYFKQGSLQSTDFTVVDQIPNNIVSINYDNINNSDVWLYKLSNVGTLSDLWTQLPTVAGTNIIYNNGASKTSYQVNSRANDQIDLVFGDGSFANMPRGPFRCYFRTSAGVTYKITPDEMRSISFSIPYVSKKGRVETLTVVASLKSTVVNATARETLDDIKSRAPQQYYTQNRMVTAEDYNTFPYSSYSNISKVKSVNRLSSGTSRYLDVLDNTGRYSSTNIFCDDGVIYKEDASSNFAFSWSTTGDITRVINNQVIPKISNKSLLHFYYAEFNRYSLTDVYWDKTTTGTSSSTGFFVNGSSVPLQVGSNVTGNNTYINSGAIVIFEPGAGNYFDSSNNIKPIPVGGMPLTGSAQIYVTVTNLVGNGSQGVLSSGLGPVSMSENVPTGAQAVTVIPAFSNSFTTTLQSQLVSLITNYTEFGIRYDQRKRTWVVVTAQDMDLTGDFSQTFEGDTTGQNKDASWLLSFSLQGTIYSVTTRGLDYSFESVRETLFYYDGRTKIYDPVTGVTVNDSVGVLKTNGDPDTFEPMSKNVLWYVYDQKAESDGYVNASKVQITYSDTNDDGVPDNPDIFDIVVKPTVNETSKFVFFLSTPGYDNFVTYKPYDANLVVTDYATLALISPQVNNYPDGQVFYATDEQKFYVSDLSTAPFLFESNDYVAKVGRQELSFQYKHNAPSTSRIDPSPNNLIDMYILTTAYENDYRAWILDTTGTVSEPQKPNAEELRVSFSNLEKYKSVSDAIIYSNATFKPLFGSKAPTELQATFKVVKNSNVVLSDTEISTRVLTYINAFFDTRNWDFGDTFYFTELATYVQQQLAPHVASIIIVPNSINQSYGSLQQITSAPNEILISAATVENIEVISAITAAQLNLQTTIIN